MDRASNDQLKIEIGAIAGGHTHSHETIAYNCQDISPYLREINVPVFKNNGLANAYCRQESERVDPH